MAKRAAQSQSGKSIKITFLTDIEKGVALDQIAANLDRDRTYVLNEAIDAYLEVQQWQLADIKKAIAEADAGNFASDDEVAAAFARYIPDAD